MGNKHPTSPEREVTSVEPFVMDSSLLKEEINDNQEQTRKVLVQVRNRYLRNKKVRSDD